MGRKEYEKALRKRHVELCALQDWVQRRGVRAIVVFEGRDAAGKGGLIKAITDRVSPRVFRIASGQNTGKTSVASAERADRCDCSALMSWKEISPSTEFRCRWK